jgi:LPXTG-motif cell wall-anchored protein
MDFGEFFGSWTFIIIMIVALLGLIGLLLFLRNKKEDE